jgi:UDP-glucose 4-epimerase
MTQQRIELWNGESVRDFLYVSDWVDAMLAIAETDQTKSQTLNIGSGRGTRVGDLAEQIGRWFQVPVVDLKRPLTGSLKLICNASKLQQLTGWTSRVSFEEGLQRTMEACRGEDAHAEAPRG